MRQVTRKGLMTVAAATGVLAVTGGYAHADSGANGAAAGSPGVLSGNTVQVPVHVPVNVCGNTVNVIGLLNPATGNACANIGGGSHSRGGGGAHAGGRTSDSPGVGSGNTVQVPVDVPVNVCGNSVNVVGLGNGAGGNRCANTGGGHWTTPPGGGSGTTPPGTPEHPGHPGHPSHPGHPGHPCPPDHSGHHPGHPGHPTHPGHPAHPGHPSRPSHPGYPSTPQQPINWGSSHIKHPGTQHLSQPQGAAQLAHTGSELPVGMLVPAAAGALLGGALLYRRARAHV
ncbi:chaplin [Streptomyces sp. NPDC001020]